MATYAIGDVQGCWVELQALLEKIQFDPAADTLWFTGDIVNRGPESLAVLRFIKSLGARHVSVLGNHDLHLIAVFYGYAPMKRGDTLAEILAAPDSEELIHWLKACPLLHQDEASGFVMVHAGLAPFWTLQQATQLAQELASVLSNKDQFKLFLQNMYGNQPDCWSETLQGVARWRCITNYFTRVRFCRADGSLDLAYKGVIDKMPSGLTPWFALPHRKSAEEKIIFGHWAALNGKVDQPGLYPLDTGCVWGNCLTAMRLEDEKRFHVRCASRIPL